MKCSVEGTRLSQTDEVGEFDARASNWVDYVISQSRTLCFLAGLLRLLGLVRSAVACPPRVHSACSSLPLHQLHRERLWLARTRLGFGATGAALRGSGGMSHDAQVRGTSLLRLLTISRALILLSVLAQSRNDAVTMAVPLPGAPNQLSDADTTPSSSASSTSSSLLSKVRRRISTRGKGTRSFEAIRGHLPKSLRSGNGSEAGEEGSTMGDELLAYTIAPPDHREVSDLTCIKRGRTRLMLARRTEHRAPCHHGLSPFARLPSRTQHLPPVHPVYTTRRLVLHRRRLRLGRRLVFSPSHTSSSRPRPFLRRLSLSPWLHIQQPRNDLRTTLPAPLIRPQTLHLQLLLRSARPPLRQCPHARRLPRFRPPRRQNSQAVVDPAQSRVWHQEGGFGSWVGGGG